VLSELLLKKRLLKRIPENNLKWMIKLDPITSQNPGTPPPDRRIENQIWVGERLEKLADFFFGKTI
jgi:hypothetical protein